MSTRKRGRSVAKAAPAQETFDEEEEQDVQLPTPSASVAAAMMTPHRADSEAAIKAGAATPFRVPRLEEQQQLQRLNKRLEYYILIMRERENVIAANQAEIEELRRGNVREMTEIRTTYEGQLASAEDAKEAAIQAQNKYKGEVARLERLVASLRGDLDQQGSKFGDLEGRMRAKNGDAKDAAQRIAALEDEVAKLENALQGEQKAHASTAASLADARDKSAKAAKAVTEEKANGARLRDQLAAATRDFERKAAEFAEVKEQIARLEQENRALDHTLRDEFGRQLKHILAERQHRFEQEKDELAAQLKAEADDRAASNLHAIDELTQSVEALAQDKKALEAKVSESKSSHSSLVLQRDQFKSRAAQLEGDLADLQAKYAEMEKYYLARCASYIQQFRQKEEEFRLLMGVKIHINMEIKAYRALLEDEEVRLGIRDKLSSLGAPSAAAAAAAALNDPTNNIVVVYTDLVDSHVQLRNGTTDTIALEGFELRSSSSKAVFKFPKANVAPGDYFTVFFGKDAKKRAEATEGELAFGAANMSFSDGDVARFFDKRNRLVTDVCLVDMGEVAL